MIVFTVGGGCLGFYLQHRIGRRHKEQLRKELPELDEKLAKLTARRRKLEHILKCAQNAARN